MRGFEASHPRSRREPTDRISDFSYRSRLSRSSSEPHSARAESCQCVMNALTSARSIGSRDRREKPCPVSQSSGTADGRVVTT